MLSGLMEKTRMVWWVVVILAALLLAVACGGPKNEQANNQAQSSSRENIGNQSAQGVASGSGGQGSQTAGNKSQTSPSSVITGVDACASFSWLANSGAAGFSSQWGAGYQVEASKSPPSEFAADVAKFAEDSLEDVLDGDVSAECFYESKTANDGGVYVALSLPGAPPTGIASEVGEAMGNRGGTVLGAFSSTSAEGTFDMVSLQDLPIKSPVGTPATGTLYFITTQEGVFQAVMLANYTDLGGQTLPGGSDLPSEPSSTQAPDSERMVTGVVPSGTAGRINEELEPALEDALGVDLIVENYFQNSAGGSETVMITYFIDGDFPSSADLSKGLSEGFDKLDGTISFSFSGAEGTTVGFEGVKVGGYTVGGGATHAVDTNQIAVTLTSVSGQ